MLVLTRRLGEGLLIGDNIKITVEKISKGQIKIGIEAPEGSVILLGMGEFGQRKDYGKLWHLL